MRAAALNEVRTPQDGQIGPEGSGRSMARCSRPAAFMLESAIACGEFRSIPLLQSLPEPWRQRLALQAARRQIGGGAQLFEVGDECRDLMLLVSGTVRVSKPLPNGHDLLVYRLQPGELCVMSTACLLGRTPYPVRGLAETDVRGLILPGALLREMIPACEPLRDALFGAIATRLSGLLLLLEEVVSGRLDARLAGALLVHGPAIHLTHQQLADELGSAREVVSRLLESFEARGLVSLHRGRIDVLDAETLGALVRACQGA